MKSQFANWSDVRVFLAVLREGSTLAASRKLGMAQPTVARRIDALEHALGLTLFDRDTRGFRPTPAAQELTQAAEAIERASCTFSERATDLARPRPIRVTAFSANFSSRASAIFSDYSQRHPEVDFEFLPSTSRLDLLAGEADIALRLTRQPPEPELIQRKISTARFALFASRSYGDENGLPSSETDLAGHRFISFRRNDVPAYFDTYLRARVSPEQIIMTCSEIDLMTAAIRSGRGIGIMNVRLAEHEADFVQCFEPPPELDAEHLLLVSPDAWRRPEVKDFVKFFAPRYAALYK